MNENDKTRTSPAPGAAPAFETTAAPDAPPRDGTLPQSPGQADAILSGFAANASPVIPGYDLMPEIARGGMGVVYRARDLAFDREVAVKVMLPGMSAAEFVREARITGRLPHPGIPPVHALGELPDGRPFLAMKLIRGDTLDKVLKSRADLSADRGRLLAAFEQMCHAVGFAHAQGIIHRDLKPSNVMVGAFGEVQVMDWGLTKEVTSNEQTSNDTENTDAPLAASQRRASSDTDAATMAGQVKGTPAYMAPEQARGEPVDARADVFALGGILAAILTGKPPFAGDSVMDTILRAAQADLGDTFARLDASGADTELLALAKRCLAARADERPSNGVQLAEEVAAYRAEVEDRLRRAERERAAAEAKAEEQRKRRRVQFALAAALVLLVVAGAGFAWWWDKQAGERQLADERAASEQLRLGVQRKAAEARADAEAEFKGRQARQGIDASLKLSTDLRKQYKFKEAAAAPAQAAELAKGGAPERVAEVEQALRDLALVAKLDDIRYRKWMWVGRLGNSGAFNYEVAPLEYPQALTSYGLDVEQLAPAEAAQRIAASAVKADLVAAIDDWALHTEAIAEPVQAQKLTERLLAVSRLADPRPWTDRLRNPALWRDKTGLARLADDVDLAAVTPSAVALLATLMESQNLEAERLLLAARRKHPSDFELAFALGRCNTRNPQRDSIIKPGQLDHLLQAANALGLKHKMYSSKPGVMHFAVETGDRVGPLEAALTLRPDNIAVWGHLGDALSGKGDREGAIVAWTQVTRLGGRWSFAYRRLGELFNEQGDVDSAISAWREAIRLDPREAAFNGCGDQLGKALEKKGDLEAALAAYREAVRQEPDGAFGLQYAALGDALSRRGEWAAAVAAYHESVRLYPDNSRVQFNLGSALRSKGDVGGAVAAFKKAIELDPKNASANLHLGSIYLDQNKLAETIACARAAIKADANFSNAHALLGLAFQRSGDAAGARAALSEAARLDKQ